MRGFLPDEDPITNLKGEEFKGLNQAMEDLPYLFSTGKIRSVTYTYLENFDKINTNWLDERQAKALQRDLAFLAAAFLHTKKESRLKIYPLLSPSLFVN